MDYDRKSIGSSFYGGPRASFDALNSDFPPPGQQPGHTRVDSTSSFYGARDSRADLYDAPTAGYNQASFIKAPRLERVKGDEEAGGMAQQPWDVYADFNNDGPRYAPAAWKQDDGYRQVPSPTPYGPQTPGIGKGSTTSFVEGQPVEMVTVPALGPEWKAEELRGMSKREQRKEKLEDMATKWKLWRRGETGICGSYFTRRFTAWFIFGLCAAIAIILAFTVPRVPSFSTNQVQPLSPTTDSAFNQSVPTEFSRAPANFSFPGLMKLQADTGGNFLPLSFKNIHGTIFDSETDDQVATGDTGHLTVPAKSFPVINLNLNFTFSAINASDTTWNNWYNACRNKAFSTNGQRPAVKFRLILDMDIVGLIGKRSTSTEVTDGACPIELPLNSV